MVLSNLAGCATSAVATLTVQKFPSITNQPWFASTNTWVATNFVPVGAAVSLSVGADGDALYYQWNKDGKNFAFSTNPTLTIASAVLTNSGKYTVVVSNLVGKVTSTNTLLTVIGPPTIKTQPLKQSLITGAQLKLSVSATGTATYTNLAYQWTLASTNIPSASNATFIVTNVTSDCAGSYAVVVTNFGGAVTSSVVAVTVLSDAKPPTLTVKGPTKSLTNSNYTLIGTVKDPGSVPISNVWCYLNLGTNAMVPTNTLNMAATTNAFANWSMDLVLAVGSNIVTVVAADINGVSATNNTKIFYAPIFDATLTTNGSGTIPGWTNKVQYGTTYTLVAKPAARNLFVNWSGPSGLVTTNSTNSTTFKFTPTNTVALTVTFATNNFFGQAGDYNGLFSQANGATHDSSGFLKLTVTTNMTYSGKTLFNGKSISLSGQLDTNGTASTALDTGVTLNFGISSVQLTGTVSSVTWTSALAADLNLFSKTNPATNYVGTFTLVIPPATNGPATNGNGYGVVTVSSNGVVTFAGATADGAAVSQTVPVSTNGDWPLFVQIYPVTKTNNAGILGGWLTFANNGAPTGSVFWIKTPAYTNSLVYPAGFTNEVNILSSVFTAPTKANPKVLPNMVEGTAVFAGGNLTNDITEYLLMANDGAVFSTEPTTQIKMAKTGLVTGKFLHNATGKAVSFSGVVLQSATNVYGSFVGTNAAGSVTILGSPAD